MSATIQRAGPPVSPFGNGIVEWSGFPEYRGVDARGNVWWAYGPPPRRSR